MALCDAADLNKARRDGIRRALAALCISGGQGAALTFEAVLTDKEQTIPARAGSSGRSQAVDGANMRGMEVVGKWTNSAGSRPRPTSIRRVGRTRILGLQNRRRILSVIKGDQDEHGTDGTWGGHLRDDPIVYVLLAHDCLRRS